MCLGVNANYPVLVNDRGPLIVLTQMLFRHGTDRRIWYDPLFLSLRLVVGAPVANTSSSHVLQSPGAVFRCNITAESHHCHPMPAGISGFYLTYYRLYTFTFIKLLFSTPPHLISWSCVCADVLNCGKTCESESDHQWLGVSLSRQPGDNRGHILVTTTSLSLYVCLFRTYTHTHTHTYIDSYKHFWVTTEPELYLFPNV